MMHSHTRRARTIAVVLLAVLAAGCIAGRSFNRGESAARAGDWDAAVEHYRRAVQADPKRADYTIALERAMIAASQRHLDQARIFEARGQLDEALREYRRASEFDPPNRGVAGKVTEMERRIRDQAEAQQPRNNINQLRENARQATPPPLFNLTTVLPGIRFTNASLRDILGSIGMSAGINVTFDNTFQDRQYSVQMDNSTLEEALSQITTANQLFYKVVTPRSVIVIPDNVQKRAQYEEQVIRTFFVSHSDATELAQTLNTVIRVGGGQVAPSISANKTANTIVVRATTAVMAIIERLIDVNDNPRAEVMVDVQILEVNKSRTKQFGLDLGDYMISTVFSPTGDPTSSTSTGTGTGSTTTGGTTLTQRPFNVNAISRGINTADFWAAVPSAAVRFLESDTETRLIAKPQLRGAEGQKLTMNLGEDVPVPSTTFTPLAQGGSSFNPLTSFSYRTVGITLEITPRVTYEGEVQLELSLENSSLGKGLNVGGQNLPSFNSRKVVTKLRLRDGEANLLAGLLQEDERKSLRGFPTLLRVPVIKQLFSSNDNTIGQTDIVMLLTPHIVRTHELTQQDVNPIFVGTQQNLGLQGPPPVIIQEAIPAGGPAPAAGAAAPAGGGQPVAAPAPAAAAPTQAVPGPAVPAVNGPAPAPAAGGGPGGGQVVISPPSSEFRVGGGPYTLPISVTNASRLSSMSLTVTFNPAVVRVRTVQEGSFMRSGGVQASFTNRADATAGRVDIAIVRPGDTTGVAGTGLLAALVLDAIGPGPANLQVTGSGTAPGGGAIGLQFSPVTAVTAK
jgi:type II secretory pathway component GspD/PulD (secretin)/Tfp pilus assembly protein PilF